VGSDPVLLAQPADGRVLLARLLIVLVAARTARSPGGTLRSRFFRDDSHY
jgi:hypothetical protein